MDTKLLVYNSAYRQVHYSILIVYYSALQYCQVLPLPLIHSCTVYFHSMYLGDVWYNEVQCSAVKYSSTYCVDIVCDIIMSLRYGRIRGWCGCFVITQGRQCSAVQCSELHCTALQYYSMQSCGMQCSAVQCKIR